MTEIPKNNQEYAEQFKKFVDEIGDIMEKAADEVSKKVIEEQYALHMTQTYFAAVEYFAYFTGVFEGMTAASIKASIDTEDPEGFKEYMAQADKVTAAIKDARSRGLRIGVQQKFEKVTIGNA